MHEQRQHVKRSWLVFGLTEPEITMRQADFFCEGFSPALSINQSINQIFLFDLFGTHHVHRITHESLIMTYFQCGPLMTCGVLEWVGGGVHDSYTGGGWVSVDRRLFSRFVASGGFGAVVFGALLSLAL